MRVECRSTRLSVDVPDLVLALAVLDAHNCRAQHRLVGDDGRVWATSARILRGRLDAGEVDPTRWISRRPESTRSIHPPAEAPTAEHDDEPDIDAAALRFVDSSPACSVAGCAQRLWAPASLARGFCDKRDPAHLAARSAAPVVGTDLEEAQP